MLGVLKREAILIISLVVMLLGIVGVYTNLSYEEKELDIEEELRATATKGYLETKILESIAAKNFDDVVMYQNLANFLHVELSEETLEEIEKHNGWFSKSLRNTQDFSHGFVTGDASNGVAMAGSIASDMTVVGDLRDLSSEGTKFVKDEPYDKVVLGMAAVGVGMTVSQVMTAGSSTPLKVGASVLKVARKTGKLSKTFLKFIAKKLRKVVDVKLLKKIDYGSISKLRAAASKVAKSLKLAHVRKLFGNINTIKKNTSLMDTVSIMKYVKKPKDLGKIVKLSDKFKSNTKAVLKVLGKGALKGTVKVIKYTTLFIAQIITSIISFLIFIFTFGTKVFIWRTVKSRVF